VKRPTASIWAVWGRARQADRRQQRAEGAAPATLLDTVEDALAAMTPEPTGDERVRRAVEVANSAEDDADAVAAVVEVIAAREAAIMATDELNRVIADWETHFGGIVESSSGRFEVE